MITVDFQALSMGNGSAILDIGCGSGRHTAAAFDLDKGLVVGADKNLNDIQQAESKLHWHENAAPHEKSRWSLAAADITNLPFKDRCFDLVICSEVLEHIPDDVQAIQEIIRVLKPGKNLVVSVPRQWPETICWALSHQYRHTQGGHIRIYKAQNLIRTLQSHGTIHWRTHYAHSLHTPYWWLKCLMGPQKDHLRPVNLYHRFLTWDLMKKPGITRFLDRLLNPLMGKSVVLYFRKASNPMPIEF